MKEKRIQLFLLPFAGGSSLSFMKMLRFLDPCIEAITIEYSGRGSRKNENFIERYDDFLKDVIAYISSHRSKELPYAIFGYSMGSVLAFDIVSNNLLDSMPKHAFFCAEGSLIINNPARMYGSLPEKEFKEKIILMDGLDRRLLENESLLDSYINLIRKDFNILGQFKYPSNSKIECDATIIYSSKDSTCINMDDWSKVVNGNINFYQIGNNHFFIHQNYREIADIINNSIIGF